MVRVIENRVEIPAPVDEVFRFLSSVENVPAFAPGIEEAVLAGGEHGLEGSRLSLTTRSGRHIAAQITWFQAGRGWTVVDERETMNGWELEDVGGRTLATNYIRGDWPDHVADRIEAEAREKVHHLGRLFPTPAALGR